MEKENNFEELELTDAEAYQKQLEELEKSSKELNTVDVVDTKDIDENSKEEKVDLLQKRKRLKEIKKKEKAINVNRKLGFHRYYLSSPVKIKHVVLTVMVIIMAVLCIGKFMPYTGADNNAGDSVGGAVVGEAIYMRAKHVDTQGAQLSIDVTVTNKEKDTIYFNPSSFKLYINDKVYAASTLEADEIYANGLAKNKEKTYRLKFATDNNLVGQGTLKALMKINDSTFSLQTSVEIQEEIE